MLATRLAGVFASDALGVFSGQGLRDGRTMPAQLGMQAIGVVAPIVWTAVATYAWLKRVNAMVPLRVSDDEETASLDTSLHNERGYVL